MVNEIVDIVVILGSICGSLAMTYLPYYKNSVKQESVTGEKLEFDTRYIGSAVAAVVLAIVISVMTFDQAQALVNPGMSYVKIFVTSFVYATLGSLVINKAILTPSTTKIVAAPATDKGTLEVRTPT